MESTTAAAVLSLETDDLCRFPAAWSAVGSGSGSQGEGRGWEEALAGRCMRRGKGHSSGVPFRTFSSLNPSHSIDSVDTWG